MKNFVKNLSDGGLAEDTHAFIERVLEGADTTREEERLGAAFEFYDKHKSAAANVTLVDSFVYGSKWADAHPKPEMIDKQKFIEKTISYFTPILKTYCSKECVKELISGFVNSMEE